MSELAAGAESGDFETLLALEDAIHRFSHLDARAADAVRLRLFAGLELAQIATVLGVSLRTAKRDWAAARLWLAKELADVGGDQQPR